MDSEKSVYFVIIRLAAENTSAARIRECAPLVRSTIERMSAKECQLVFTSPDGSTFGYFLKTSANAGIIRAELCGETSKNRGGAALLNQDSLIVFEVGPDFNGVGFSKAWTWLQHHH